MVRNLGPTPHRLVVYSRDRLRREALAAYLATLPEFAVIGRAEDEQDLVLLAGLQHPDAGIIDAGPRTADSLPVLRRLRDRFPSVHLILVYERLNAPELAALRECGVAAVIPQSRGLSGLLSTLRELPIEHQPGASGDGLTARQRDILLLVASGHQVSEIAEILGISTGTVENHKRRVYAKLNATSAAHAVSRAASLGIIDYTPSSRLPGPGVPLAENQRLPVLAVIVGNPGPTLDRVQMTLIRHRIPVLREAPHPPAPQIHWMRSHRGPVMRILVSPAADQWRLGGTLGWSAILVHEGPIDVSLVEHALSHGVVAAVHAEHVVDRLVPVLHLAVAGYLAMDPAVGALVIESLWGRAAHLPPLAPTLTPREYDILCSIGRNHTVRQTARALGIAAKTVENAQSALFRKLGVHNRAAALAKAYSLGLLQPDPM